MRCRSGLSSGRTRSSTSTATATATASLQALVKRAVEAPAAPPPTALEDAIVRENKWQAIRYGRDATVIAADGRSVPIRTQILRTLDELADAAAELGGEAALHGIERIVRGGTGADRQLATFAESGDLRTVTRSIAEETALAANCAEVQ
jgi:gamma-glutamyl:cysteine ligase YbdK (ATP-grasp superfamily)